MAASLIAPDTHSPIEDAEALRKACKGWGIDEKAVIKILGHRNAVQRMQIRQAYEELYEEDLVKRLESELSGDFEKAMYRWILDPADRDAVLAHVAMKKGDYHVIIEISCVLSPEDLLAVRRAYHYRYKRSLEEDLATYSFGDFRKLLVALVTAYRYAGHEINERLANSEADLLNDAIKNEELNNDEVIRILSTRSKAQLIASFNRYRDEHGTSITKNLSSDADVGFPKLLRAVIRCIKDPRKYFEKTIRNALKGHGTDEDELTRVIVTRAERDLKDIEELYCHRNSVSLDLAVAKETSGHYKAFLLTLLGKED